MASNNTDGDGTWNSGELCSVTDRARELDVSRRSVLAATGASVFAGLATGTGTVGAQEEGDYHLKTRPTMVTEEMRANAQQNIQQYDWAASQRDSAVETADDLLDRYAGDVDDPDLDALWSLITGQMVPRGGGIPAERSILGGHSSPGDDRQWKIETTVPNPHGEGNLVVPTNDFGAYRESGLDDEGKFDPDLADDSLLVNEEHPEMGEGWGVDEGWGWIDEDDDLGHGAGNRWNFVAYYNHWFTWRPGGIRRILAALGNAYLFTGDSKYAVPGLIMLDRIADVYPDMHIADGYTQTLDGFWNNHGGRQGGRIIGSGWEGNLQRSLMPVYDALFPALDDDAVADEVLTFLGGKTEEFSGLEGKDSVVAVRENIEENWLQEILAAGQNSNMHPGRGQRPAVALSARVQDDVGEGGYTREALEWLFQPGGEIFDGDVWNEEPENWYTTGGELIVPVVDQCDRDGYWHETGLGYNRINMSGIRQVADTLKGYDGFDGADLYQHPKFQSALKINADLLLLDSFSPALGDTHSPSGTEFSLSGVQDGYEVTGEPIFAQLWHYSNGYSTAGMRGSIYDAEPEGLGDEIQAIVDAEGPLDLPSQNLPGFGFAALRDGENHTIVIGDEISYDTSEIFTEASTDIDDSFSEAIQFEAEQEGEWWEFEFDVEEAGEYEIGIEALFGPGSYGIYDLYVNGEHLDTIDFMADGNSQQVVSYVLNLPEGTSVMHWECVGKNEDSTNYKMALHSLSLYDEEARESRDNDLGNEKRAFWLYYGRNNNDAGGTAHCHSDSLSLGVAAHELHLTPDLGYPEETGSHPKRIYWTRNTISHNTVVVDRSEQDPQWVSIPRHFDGDDERVNLVDVEAPHAYRNTDEYRRTTASITVDEEHSYAVDFFRVRGGEDHLFSFHGAKGEATAEGADFIAQDGGTYAGPDVPLPGYGENTQYNQEVGDGLNYLDNVERSDDPGSKVAIDWDVEDHWGFRSDNAEDVRLRLTSFGDFDEVALADGHPPVLDGNPESLRYALLRRQGSDLESTFVSTIEHYDGDRAVESVEEVSVEGDDGHAVKVELKNGRTDYVVCAYEEGDTVTVDGTFEFEGFFGVYSIEDGESEYAYVHDGTLLGPLGEDALVEESHGEARGWVEDFTKEMSLENELSTRIGPGRHEADRHTGFVYVDNDNSNPWRSEPDPEEPIHERSQRGLGNGAYPIEGLVDGNGNRMTIDVGDKTFLRDFTDPDQLEEGGYEHIIATDDDLRIPLTSSWSWPEVDVSGLAESDTHPSFEISSVVPLEITGFAIETMGDLAAVEETERPHTDKTHNVFVYQAGISYESDDPIQLDGTEYAFDTTGEVTDSRVQIERFASDSGISLEGVVESREKADLVVTFLLANGTELPVYFDSSSGA